MVKKIIASPFLTLVAMLVFALVASPANSIRVDSGKEDHYIKNVPTQPGPSPGMGHGGDHKDDNIKYTPTQPGPSPGIGNGGGHKDHYNIKYAPTQPGPSPGTGNGGCSSVKRDVHHENNYKDIKMDPIMSGYSLGMGDDKSQP